MTDKQIRQVKEQLSERGLTFERMYRAFEGDIRVIARSTSHGIQFRYTVEFENDYPKIRDMQLV